MPYDPQKHHRRSIRLKGYDYSQCGMYFVTICVQERMHLFGEIIEGVMYLNEAGKMVERLYLELEHKFPGTECGVFQIMPNHMHCIVVVGADLRVRPTPDTQPSSDTQQTLGNHPQSPLWKILQWFKTMTTNEYIRNVKNLGWPRFNRKLWQRDYWEHIISNDNECTNITNYILNNPNNWEKDSLR